MDAQPRNIAIAVEPRTSPDDGCNHVIAHLIPDSEAAIRALNRVRPAERDHAYYATRVPHPLSGSRNSSSHIGRLSSSFSVWAYQVAALDLLRLDAGWIMGSGQTERGKKPTTFRGVEFLLCDTRDKKARQHISALLGRVYLHHQSGAWVFESLSQGQPVTYIGGQGFGDVTLSFRHKAVFWMRQNRLRVGPYQYLFQFTAPSNELCGAAFKEHESRYVDARDAFLKRWAGTVVSPHLHPLPRHTHRRVKNYVLHEDTIAVNWQRSTRVLAGVDASTGEPVAIKQYTHHDDMPGVRLHQMQRHVTTMKRFDDRPVGILPCYRHWCEHSYLLCRIRGSEVAYVTMPLALASFGEFDFTTTLPRTRLRLYRQTLQGLATIHSRGYMHCGIKPGHLLVLSSDAGSPSAAICDFGAAVEGTTSTGRDALRPAHTVAPEVWTATRQQPYTKAADVWSLAYSWLWTMVSRGGGEDVDSGLPGWRDELPWDVHDYDYGVVGTDLRGLVTRDRNAAIVAFVDEAVASVMPRGPAANADDGVADELATLLRQMLAWDPEDRISAEDALSAPVWADLVDEERPSATPRTPTTPRTSRAARSLLSRTSPRPVGKARRRKRANSAKSATS